MIKRILSLFALVVLFTTLSQAQWSYVGGFPSEDVKGNNHALAVDPDGKVWVSDYYNVDSVLKADGTWGKCRNIRVYNADGTPASFSPIKVISGAGFQDTLWNSTKGMNVDENGNIIFTTGWWTKFVKGPWIYRLNYKTGECMGGVDMFSTLNTSPTTPAIDDMGNIYCRSVLPGEPTLIYDKDFNFVGNVLDADPGYARVTVISGDGLTYYDCSYTMPGIMIYTRASEFDPFVLTDSLYGFKTESAVWDPLQDNVLWASSGNIGYSDPGLFNGTYQLTDGNWYKIDIATKTLKDSVEWHFYGDRAQSGAGEKQRSIAFSADGNTCYLGAFGTAGLYPLIEKFTKGVSPTIPVTFQVNLSVQEGLGNFTPGTDVCVVRGSFQTAAGDASDWSGTMFTTTDPDNDKVYTVTANLPTANAGTAYEYKFVIIKGGTDNWESVSNRTFTLTAPSQTLDVAFFNDVAVIGKEISVTFSCNMEFEIVSGRFNPSTDVMTVRGSFNGWSGDDVMAANPTNPNYYELTKNYTVAEGETWNYKYAYNLGAGGTDWEGDPNKTYTFTADDLAANSAFIERTYNNLDLNTVINQPCVVKFQVNVDNAVSSVTGQPFAAIESVVICGAVQPLKWPGGGWPDTDVDKVIFLKDDGTNGDKVAGDKIWTADVTFKQYTGLRIQYKYGANWGLPSNTGANDNESSVGTDHFINLVPSSSAVEVLNQWSVMGDTEITNTGVERLPINPTKYELTQNFPNPFNPTTSIRFSVLETGLVTLKIYNTLGQEIATLVNETKAPGVYNVDFDASNLTSGTYIYKVTAGKFTSSKKMMLVK
ncbi:MAG: T9SS C-terminal target domain-containing protein [Ignavibacteriales bacterium]|nr:MAG: T9SS C-terminal target domain-containing protein [Ignavibacteriales bacterium]